MTDSEPVAPSQKRFAPVVIAPTHNNAGTLADVVRRVRAQGVPVVVVNDGSTDDTARLLADLAAEDPEITVLTQPRNLGKAAALVAGFDHASAAGYTHAVTIDTDGQLDPEQIPGLLALARRTPDGLIIGQRDENIEGYPSKNRLGRRVSNLFVWMQCGVRVADSQCGFRVYPLEFLRETRCRAGRYGFETEVITRAGWAGRPIVGTPVRCHYFPKGKAVSHFRPYLDSFRGVPMHLRLMLRALSPLPHHRTERHEGTEARRHEGKTEVPPTTLRAFVPSCLRAWLRRLINWFNPMPAIRQLREDDVGRANAAAGLAMGAFIANTPLYGFHTLLSLYAARRLHLHPLSVVLGSHLSTPPVGPVLVAASVTIGHVMLRGRLPTLASYDVRQTGLWPLLRSCFLEWTLGGIVTGLFSAWVVYLGSRWLFKFAAKDREREAVPAPV